MFFPKALGLVVMVLVVSSTSFSAERPKHSPSSMNERTAGAQETPDAAAEYLIEMVYDEESDRFTIKKIPAGYPRLPFRVYERAFKGKRYLDLTTGGGEFRTLRDAPLASLREQYDVFPGAASFLRPDAILKASWVMTNPKPGTPNAIYKLDKDRKPVFRGTFNEAKLLAVFYDPKTDGWWIQPNFEHLYTD